MRFLEEKFVPVAAKIGTQKHLMAIRDSFMITMPLTIAGAVAVLINNFANVFNENGLNVPAISNGWSNFIVSTGIKDVCNYVNAGTVGTLAVLIVVVLAYNLAKANEGNPIATAAVATAVYTGLIPRALGSTAEGTAISGLGATFLDAKGLFVGMLLGIAVGEIFPRLSKLEKLKITMPDGVPPAVANSFNTLIPAVITVFGLVAIGTAVEKLSGMTLWALITKFVSAPLSSVADSVFTAVIENLFISVLWIFGIHGASIAGSITQPILYPLLQENTAAYNAGATVEYTYVQGFRAAYTQYGGSGATFGLIIAVFLFSKSKASRTIIKISVACGLFEINEPITFGIPIVMNPIYAIPFIIGPALMSALSYFLIKAGFIGKIVLEVPWVTPPVLNSFLATGGNFASAIWSIISLVILTVLWTPFVFMSNRLEAKEAAE